MTKDAKRIFKNVSASSRSLASPRMNSLHAHNLMKSLTNNEMMKSTGMCVYRDRPAPPTWQSSQGAKPHPWAAPWLPLARKSAPPGMGIQVAIGTRLLGQHGRRGGRN